MSQLVTVIAPSDEPELMLVESLLRDAGVPFSSKNVATQNLFGIGQIGGINPATGPIEVQVLEEDLKDAREALRDLLSHDADSVEYEIPQVCPACDAQTFGAQTCPKCGLTFGEVQSDLPGLQAPALPQEADPKRLARLSMVWAILWLGGIGSLIAIRFSLKAIGASKVQIPRSPTPRLAYFGLGAGIAGLLFWVLHWYGVSQFFPG